ncbi:uncharacterized protein LOC117105288 [Anneissia japonica]|uniref:uncharacterized protein LOC117105288 n=1 Tax=Anneissia japonica TaxID=1529436 RepID=UPI0014259D3E|nr:uncharacterized protein LOC117105288 [Anneissia japonica]
MHFTMEKSVRGLLLLLSLSTIGVHSQTNDRANALPKDDPGHNTHQEYVIYACLSVSGILIGLVVLILWFLVDRTKEQLRNIDAIMPEIIMNHRQKKNARDEEEMFGTLTAHQDLEYKRMASTESSNNRNSVELTGFRKYGTSSSAVVLEHLDVDTFEIDSDINAMDITVETTVGDSSRRTLVGNTPPPYNSPPAYDNPAAQVGEHNVRTNGSALQRNSLDFEEDPRNKRRYKKKYYESNL